MLTEVAAWTALIVAVGALTKQAADLFRGRKKERVDIAFALEKEPLLREQLELGNFREAMELQQTFIRDLRDELVEEKRKRRRVQAHCEELLQLLRSNGIDTSAIHFDVD